MINSNAANRCKMICFENETLYGALRDMADWIESNSPHLAGIDVQWEGNEYGYYSSLFYDYKFGKEE